MWDRGGQRKGRFGVERCERERNVRGKSRNEEKNE